MLFTDLIYDIQKIWWLICSSWEWKSVVMSVGMFFVYDVWHLLPVSSPQVTPALFSLSTRRWTSVLISLYVCVFLIKSCPRLPPPPSHSGFRGCRVRAGEFTLRMTRTESWRRSSTTSAPPTRSTWSSVLQTGGSVTPDISGQDH